MSNIIYEDGCRTKPQREEAPSSWENRRRLKPSRVKWLSSPLCFLNNLAVSSVLPLVMINQLVFPCKYSYPYSLAINWFLADDARTPKQKFISFLSGHWGLLPNDRDWVCWSPEVSSQLFLPWCQSLSVWLCLHPSAVFFFVVVGKPLMKKKLTKASRVSYCDLQKHRFWQILLKNILWKIIVNRCFQVRSFSIQVNVSFCVGVLTPSDSGYSFTNGS